MKNYIKAIAIVSMLAIAAPAFANPQFKSGPELNAKACDTHGAPVIDVKQKIVNSIDSGTAGNYWAFLDMNRHIKVWEVGENEYCATVKYEGKFDGQAGQASPGNTGTLSGKEKGSFEGGYRAMITGMVKSSPSWDTKGNVGTTDYQCTISGSCPGAINWIDQYFDSGYGFSYEWWGWIYHGGKYGTWINASTGNSGDIIE